MSYDVLDIARYVVNYSIDKQTPVSNLKLQKLMYYIQANFLVNKGQCCFYENITKTKYGSFIPIVYDEFREYGCLDIDDVQLEYANIEYNKEKSQIEKVKRKFNDNFIVDYDKRLINEVVDSYNKYNTIKITNKVLQEKPCRITKLRDVISNDLILEFYSINKDKILGAIN